MKKYILPSLGVMAATLALGACTDIPPCSSSDLDCNVGAYSEERTFRDATDKTTNFNKTPEPVVQAAPPPAQVTTVETTTEPVPAPIEPMDTQVMEKADEKPIAKGMK